MKLSLLAVAPLVLLFAAPSGAAPDRAEPGAFFEVVRDGNATRLTEGCRPDPNFSGPVAEILDPSGSTRFIAEACGDGMHVEILGWTKSLPGQPTRARVRFGAPDSASGWLTSDRAEIDVTRFGAVGQPVEGTFRATMIARFNEPAVTVAGRFRVVRKTDREPP